MAITPPYKPDFPYKGDQIILSSDRVLLHSKNDSIFLFGKQSVSLSSTKTINLDAIDKVLIYTNKIELGTNAEALGEPLVLGRTLNTQLIIFLSALKSVGNQLANASESNLGASLQLIAGAGQIIAQESERLSNLLGGESQILSKTTYTR
jgi:hypothetical protein